MIVKVVLTYIVEPIFACIYVLVRKLCMGLVSYQCHADVQMCANKF